MSFIKPNTSPKEILIAVSVNNGDGYIESFFNSINMSINKAVFMNQTHSTNIKKITKFNYLFYRSKNLVKNTDAMITNKANMPLVVRTADCLPIVLYCKSKNVIAVIHAGWAGVLSNIIEKTVQLMIQDYKVDANNIYAYIGPRILMEDYEVGVEVANKFNNKIKKGDSWFVDIAGEATQQLLKLGLKEDNIEDSELGTYSDERFFSYRKDKNKSGRILTLAMIK